jgi:class 3 adenylate cyclase
LEAHRVERKLSAIFAADVEGYSRLMGQDEVGTLRTLTAYRVITDRLIASHRGRIFNTAGDSLVADFASAVDAVQCAVAVQEAVTKENSRRSAAEQMRFRIGIHVGDIIVQGENLFGDAVNVAARLESLAEPGGICVSGAVQDHIGTKLPVEFIDLGPQQVKNIAQPIKAYRISSQTSPTATPIISSLPPRPDKPSIAVLPFANMSGDPEQEYFADGMVEEIIFSNRYFSDVLYRSLLPEVQWLTRLIFAHRHLCSSGVFLAQLHRNYTRPHAPLRLPHQWARHPGRSGRIGLNRSALAFVVAAGERPPRGPGARDREAEQLTLN